MKFRLLKCCRILPLYLQWGLTCVFCVLYISVDSCSTSGTHLTASKHQLMSFICIPPIKFKKRRDLRNQPIGTKQSSSLTNHSVVLDLTACSLVLHEQPLSRRFNGAQLSPSFSFYQSNLRKQVIYKVANCVPHKENKIAITKKYT